MPSKKIRIRLYADENFPVPSSTFLKSKGISVVHAYDVGKVNTSDRVHLQEAKNLRRTIITLDRDYLNYPSLTTKDSFGAIVISTGNATPNHINTICQKALPKISQHAAKGSFIRITMDKITFEKEGKTTRLSY